MISVSPDGNKLAALRPGTRFLSWRVNLLVFGLLIIIVLAVFFFQLSRIQSSFQHKAIERSQMVIGVIQENVNNAILAGEVIDETINTFLASSAAFAAYLDTISPFNRDELTAFAQEAGLAGITVVRDDVPPISGPVDWLSGAVDCKQSAESEKVNRTHGLAVFSHHFAQTSSNASGCLLVGLNVTKIEQLRQQTGLKAQMLAVSRLSGIRYVHLEDSSSSGQDNKPKVKLLTDSLGTVAETRLSSEVGTLVVGIEADRFVYRRGELRKQFFFFAVLLCLLGGFFSWLLKRYQSMDLEKSREFERMLARQHEEAALGRATASIAHEVRNPLNAINMGLQRLLLESDNLTKDQEKLLVSMREATKRTDSIISRLKRFARDLQPNLQEVHFDQLLEKTVHLYDGLAKEHQITIKADIKCSRPVAGDPDLLGELLENLVKNSLESETGFVSISLNQKGTQAELQLVNEGFYLSDQELAKMAEPYFTTKTRGTGLGLALCKRIVQAHSGRLLITRGVESETVEITVLLPLLPYEEKTE